MRNSFEFFEFEKILAHGLPDKLRIGRISKFGMLFNKIFNFIDKVGRQGNCAVFLRRHVWRNGSMLYNLYYAMHSVIIKYSDCVMHGVRWFRWRVIVW